MERIFLTKDPSWLAEEVTRNWFFWFFENFGWRRQVVNVGTKSHPMMKTTEMFEVRVRFGKRKPTYAYIWNPDGTVHGRTVMYGDITGWRSVKLAWCLFWSKRVKEETQNVAQSN